MEIRQVEKISSKRNRCGCEWVSGEHFDELAQGRTSEGRLMALPIDTGLEFYRQVLALRGYRQEILSADIANASTPGFKAVDLDFAAALNGATQQPNSNSRAGSRRLMLVDDNRQMTIDGN